MNGKTAKMIRRHVYGDHSIRARKYRRGLGGAIIADNRRRAYQRFKKDYKQGGIR